MENRRRSAIEIARQEARNAREKRGGQNLVRVSVCAGSRRPETDGEEPEEESDRPDYSGK